MRYKSELWTYTSLYVFFVKLPTFLYLNINGVQEFDKEMRKANIRAEHLLNVAERIIKESSNSENEGKYFINNNKVDESECVSTQMK